MVVGRKRETGRGLSGGEVEEVGWKVGGLRRAERGGYWRDGQRPRTFFSYLRGPVIYCMFSLARIMEI